MSPKFFRNSDGWQKDFTNAPSRASHHTAAPRSLLIKCIFSCLRQRRSGGHLLQVKNTTSTCQWVEMREALAEVVTEAFCQPSELNFVDNP